MKAIEIIMQYIDYKDLSKRAFEIDNSLSNGYLGKQLSRNADLGEGVLNRILENCPDISPEWLLTGGGEMIVAEDDATVSSNKKPSAGIGDGFGERYF
jgi:hypothetical protein